MFKAELIDVITGYRNLSFTDRIAFYSTISNDVNVSEANLQDFLTETRMKDGSSCIFCEGSHVVKNGKRKDGVQRYICRDCGRSFIPSSHSLTSGTRKSLSVWCEYIRCMMDRKTLKEASEECGISVTTAFAWRHKILDGLQELTEKVYLDGIVEADETFFNVSYKGNHMASSGSMPITESSGTLSGDFTGCRPNIWTTISSGTTLWPTTAGSAKKRSACSWDRS